MATTPDRQNISALSRLQSPRTPSSPGTVAAHRVVEAVSSFVEFHHKWKLAVEKGSQFCNAIRNVKKNVLQPAAPTTAAQANENPYPDNLLLYCKNLLLMVTIMEDVVTNAGNIVRQLTSLKDCFEEEEHAIGQTWSFHRILTVMERALASYKRELSTRAYVAENIGHTLSADQLSLFACSWNHMMDCETRDRELLIKMMMFEFRLTG